MLKGRLGLEKAQIAHADRHGLLYLDRGALTVVDGCLHFDSGGGALPAGEYQLPHQTLSAILIGPGTTVSHDVLRILARHGTTLIAVGTDATRLYTAPALGPDRSDVARAQARAWADDKQRVAIARKMYARRLGEVLPHTDIEVLRGIEGARVKESYKLLSQAFGLKWRRRDYNRANPDATDLANQAINHAATAVRSAAGVAVACVSALPQLGFIHEDSDQSFVLDIADLYREAVTLRLAFAAAKRIEQGADETVDRLVRQSAAREFRRIGLVPKMIDDIQSLFGIARDGTDGRDHA
ncbi:MULTISPECIES: type I-E CRISPR-associated endonuclease Cas1e [unclassified Rubrivivax]|uniref:type I-E CRISPR-associated endonuclease Cas1e n=1 Tax=unclassified Rubrivivax TaxID=2649762 RepID=UPI001E56D90B|nr:MULTISPECIES: type I-E CRISPR-associated endonuclease Cas1e [unclassified Rubrivivax]MCC9598493.1 type I-E CRISPR-associated endonuclease Cas1e [Rubrivivax sp. JA1055]MCC9648193.1 type I-E CRISPR-associated endonuclease Cas1e [Rubrivivax sp. JA1029]